MNTRNTILIADDMEVNRAILAEMFSSEYRILEAEDGMEALELLERESMTIAVVLLDIVMPRMDGYELLREMSRRGMLAQIPAVMVTSEYTTESEVRAFDLGVSDIILKPFEPHVVKRRVRNVIDLYRHKNHLETLVEEQAYSLQASNEAMLDALSSVIEYRSLESGQHIRRIRMFTKILLEDVARAYPEYGISEQQINIIASASSMHDIGKIAIPDSILNKPGRLTAEEFEIMKTHTTKGCEMLESIGWMENLEYLQFAYNICRYHHERWDGRGYPDGLKGDNIPICAQVAGIADVYDALTTDRVYKAAYSHEKAVSMVLGGECGVFSPKLLDCFRNVQDRFAALSREFADGRRSLKADSFVKETSRLAAHDGELDTTQLGQLKYFTLLKYLQATVLEVDLDAGIYHMVYSPNADFDKLRGGNLFEEAYQSFVQGPVHPDDREMLDSCMTGSLKELFETGEAGHFWEFRVKSSRSGTYCWYRSTLLRVNTENPRQHRALIVFENIDGEHTAYGSLNPDEQQLILALRGVCSSILTCNLAEDTCSRARQNGSERTAGFAETIRLMAQTVYPEDRGCFLESLAPDALWNSLEHVPVRSLEFRQLDDKAKYRWMELCCVRTGEFSGQMRPVVFFEWDIHERKLAEQENGRSLERLEAVIQRGYEATLQFDMENRRYKLLHECEQLPQIPPEGEISDLIQRVRSDLHPDDYKKLEKTYGVNYINNAFRAGTRQLSYEFRFRAGTGWQWYEAVIIRGEDGCWQDFSLIVFVRRIAVHMMRSLPAAQNKDLGQDLAQLLHMMPGGAAMILLDDELTVMQGTDGFFSMLGYTYEEFYAPPVQGKALRVIYMEERVDVISELPRLAAREPVFHTEFQVLKKDGRRAWLAAEVNAVRREDGVLVLCGHFLDVTRTHRLTFDTATDNSKLLKMLHIFGDILFDYDLRTGSLKFSESFQKKFGVAPPATFEKLIELCSDRIYGDDLERYMEMLSQITRMEGDQETIETEFRYLSADGSYKWCQERICLLRDKDGIPSRALGVISDIDRYRLQSELLETRATTDQLTGLYNRATTETLIGEALSGEQPQALFVVDIDDFKIVNDSCGHLMGDQVLRKISNKILAQFRRDDVVGRIGGDEFVVLLKNVPDQDLISKKAASLLSALGELFADLDQRRYITASIGVAVYPKDGVSYEELFQKADAALYASKHWGKEQWRMYSDDLAVIQPALEHPLKPARIEGAGTTADVNSFISQAAGILYTMEDAEAVRALLDMAAREYGLSHIHVDETDGIGKRLFEWNANSAISFRSSWAVSPGSAKVFREINAKSEPFVCNDAREAPEPLRSEFLSQGITAWLQAPVRENGRTYAVVGFSESGQPHEWTVKEIEICQFLARSVSLIYLKKQLATQLEQAQWVNDLLFNQAALESYVVDGGYSVQKANQKLNELLEIPCGEKCYAVLRNRRSPCEECPVRQLSRSQSKAFVNGIYVEALGAYCGVTATDIKRVNSNDAYLITLDRRAGGPKESDEIQEPGE